MNEIIIHEKDDSVIEKITDLAKKNDISPEEEAQKLLRWAVQNYEKKRVIDNYERKINIDELPYNPVTQKNIDEAKELCERFAHLQTTDSVDLLREDRDR